MGWSRQQESGPVASASATSDGPSGGANSATTHGQSGFRATLSDAGLWDLVQMKCQARARGVVQITTGSHSGELYFADGQIVHATWGSQLGEGAALEILSWREGSWDPCERSWPARHSIATTWQALLLRAAQRYDEAQRKERISGVTQAVHSPVRAPVHTPAQVKRVEVSAQAVPAPAAAQATEVRKASRLQPTAAAEPERGIGYRPDDFEHAVRLDAKANLLSGHGDAQQLAGLAAYVCGLGDVVGELMGMGELIALDAGAGAARCLIFRDDSGDTVALRPRPDVDLERLKVRLGL